MKQNKNLILEYFIKSQVNVFYLVYKNAKLYIKQINKIGEIR